LSSLNPENIPANMISIDILRCNENNFFQARQPTTVGVKHPVVKNTCAMQKMILLV
jgi:hypothetical protein